MRARSIVAGLISILPRRWKPTCYRRMLGYEIGHGVRIGVSLIDVESCTVGDNAKIGHGNLFIGTRRLSLGDHVRIGHLNIFRGGDELLIDSYAEFIRLNEVNSIPDPIVVNLATPRLHVGAGTVVTAGHKIDFTDEVTLGRRVIVGGRNSSIWTHNRQRTAAVAIGDLAYLGSEIRMTPGSSLPDRCILGIGSVVTGAIDAPRHLIAGVPARPLQPLSEEEMFLVERKTREDLPDDL